MATYAVTVSLLIDVEVDADTEDEATERAIEIARDRASVEGTAMTEIINVD